MRSFLQQAKRRESWLGNASFTHGWWLRKTLGAHRKLVRLELEPARLHECRKVAVKVSECWKAKTSRNGPRVFSEGHVCQAFADALFLPKGDILSSKVS